MNQFVKLTASRYSNLYSYNTDILIKRNYVVGVGIGNSGDTVITLFGGTFCVVQESPKKVLKLLGEIDDEVTGYAA